MLTALTPLVEEARRGRLWLRCAAAYTAAGLLASAVAGAVLGGLGNVAGFALTEGSSAAFIAAFAVVVAAREAQIVRFAWPQPQRASRGAWARRWGIQRAAVLWGLDIGSFFTTWMTFLGAWWLAALAALSGDPAFAAGLFAAYWSGRALVVWLGPTLVPTSDVMPWLAATWRSLHRPFQVVHASVVVVGAAIAVSVGFLA